MAEEQQAEMTQEGGKAEIVWQNADERVAAELPPTVDVPPSKALQQTQFILPEEEWRRWQQQADVLVTSGFLPTHLKDRNQVLAIGLYGRDLGLPFTVSIRGLYAVKNNVEMEGWLMLGLIYKHGGIKVSIEDGEKDGKPWACKVTMHRPPHTPVTKIFTMDDARRAKLLDKSDSNWQKYPKSMLSWRAVSNCARLVCPDVIGGLYVTGETSTPSASEKDDKPIDADYEERERDKGSTPMDAYDEAQEDGEDKFNLPPSKTDPEATEEDEASPAGGESPQEETPPEEEQEEKSEPPAESEPTPPEEPRGSRDKPVSKMTKSEVMMELGRIISEKKMPEDMVRSLASHESETPLAVQGVEDLNAPGAKSLLTKLLRVEAGQADVVPGGGGVFNIVPRED